MKKNAKIVRLISISILAITLILACAKKGAGAAQEPDPIKIAYIGPMTGDNANYGFLMSNAVKLAVDSINEGGGVNGKDVELIIEDTEGRIEKGNSAAQKLINIDKVNGVVGPVFSSVGNGVAAQFQLAKIPLISPSATSPDFTNKGDYIFRTVINDTLQAEVLGRYIKEELAYDSLAILYMKNDYSQGLTNAVISTYENAGGVVTVSESAFEGDKDFKTQLTKIKASNPQALFLPVYAPEGAQMLKQMEQLAMDIPVISADGFSNPEILSLAGELANGVIFSGSPITESDKLKAFSSEYKNKFAVDADAFSQNSYDGTMILVDAIKESLDPDTGAVNPDQVQANIASVRNYIGVSGNISFASNGDVNKNIALLEIVDSEFRQTGLYTVENGQLVEQ